ncbi:MAG TPA: alpha/beta hydrolase [Gammaproteobacteria bacterium]|nr:alpha/beta hydrolase [Gammaproteobacteria bacterium]
MLKRPAVAIAAGFLSVLGYVHAGESTGCTTAQTQCSGYAQVNGLRMYYEIHGSGAPFVLIHGGGSTIQTSFGRVLPEFAKTHQVIAMELQAHGHTGDRDDPETFSQDADDVNELLRQLGVAQADILGFSNGGQTALELALRHPERVRRLVLASMFYARDGAPAAFWDGMAHAKFSDMPQIYKDAYLKINPDPAALLAMFKRDSQRMQAFKGWTDAQIRSIQAPAFIVIGDQDLVLPEHALKMSRLMPHARLAIMPGIHGGYLGEAMTPDTGSKQPECFAAMVDEFLAAPAAQGN